MLNYEGDTARPETPCCDVCEKEADARLREEPSLIDFFRRNKRAYTIDDAARVLARAGNIRWSEGDAGRCTGRLVGEGKLKKLKSFFWDIFWKDKLTLGSAGETFR
jgi:ATP-dependent DNA helicase RecQ